MITVDTKLIALLGTPLSQSFSAKMQNTAFDACGLDYRYFPIECGPEALEAIVNGIRYMHFAGFGVTKPNKVEVIPYLDSLDEFARKMGAVNTVVVENGRKLKGYNTDGEGFLRSLNEHYDKSLSESKFICIGAGGAARAICCSLAYQGAGRRVVSSLYDWESKALVQDINEKFAQIASMVTWDKKEALEEEACQADVIINATGIGMGEHINETPVSKEIFHPGMTAFDAAYNPNITRFLTEAKEAGCKTFNGLGMLLYQGTAQFELWTGKKAPVELMHKTLKELVQGKM